MSEILIREALVFGGAVAGAAWGYYLGKFVARRRFASEVRSSLEAFERWAVDVCRALESLERFLVGMGLGPLSGIHAERLVDARAALHDAKIQAPSLKAADEAALNRFLSRVTRPEASAVEPH